MSSSLHSIGLPAEQTLAVIQYVQNHALAFLDFHAFMHIFKYELRLKLKKQNSTGAETPRR